MKEKNLADPRPWTVERSISQLADRAREIATEDHRGTFANERERDRIASVYAQRVADRLRDGCGR